MCVEVEHSSHVKCDGITAETQSSRETETLTVVEP